MATCAERFIELVPNQNSLGHFERWLKHPEYHGYAECPDGFVHPISGVRKDCGSTLTPSSESFDLVSGLYEQLLPNFRSRRFNIGCDEPWELGEGKSAKASPEKSRGELFCAWVGKLSARLNAKGYTPYLWADVALQYPEYLKQLPTTTQALLWGYEADHPFDEQCELLQEAGVDFLVCPGDSSWNSLFGRYGVSETNIQAAATAADRWGAKGLLVTHWGDNGHAQPWPTQFPGLVLGAESAWNGSRADASCVASGIDYFFAQRPKAGLGQWLLDFGRIDDCVGASRFNRSLLYGLLRESPFADDFEEAMAVIDEERLESIAKSQEAAFAERGFGSDDGRYSERNAATCWSAWCTVRKDCEGAVVMPA